MPNKIANRVKMTVSGTPGTGTITLGSALAGFQSFAGAGVSNSDTVPYIIEDGAAWEIGVGTYTATGTTMSRSVTASSNSGNAINATSAAIVMISPLAADLQAGTAANNLVALDGSAKLPAVDGSALTNLNAGAATSGTLPVTRGGTGVSTSTGTGSVVLSNSPTLVTPALGTPASGNLANCTFPTLNQNTTGTASNVTGTVAVANGGTGLTSLTAGYIPYGNGTGAFGNSSSLFWDSANSRLGIGTSSPVLKLDVAGASSQMRIYSSTDTNPVYTQYRVGSSIAYVGMDGSGGSPFGSAYGLVMWNSASAPILFSTSDTERMRITSGGLVGIGTSSPITAFNLSGGTSAVYQTFTNTSGSYQHFYIGNPSNALTFGQSNLNGSFSANELMRLDAAGNLGLGVTPSAWGAGWRAFEFGGAGGNALMSGGSASWLTSNCYYNGTNWIYKASYNASYYLQNGGVHSWLTSASGTAGNAISFTQAMTLDASGRLGIGTSSPATLLHVYGGTSRITQDGTVLLEQFTTTANAYVGTASSHPLIVRTGNTDRATIDNNGNVVINTAAIATTATDGFLYVPTCAGTPTGTPTTYTGRAPIVVNTTNNKLYFYSGGAWRDAGP
jgi:hypothetical protein